MVYQQAADYFLGSRRHMNHSPAFLALGFLRGEYDAMLVELNVPGLDALDLEGATAGFPCEFKHVSESISLGVVVPDFYPFLRGDDLLAALGLRLLDVLDRRSVNVTEFLRPIERPLDGDNRTSAEGGRPGGMLVRPFHHMKRFQGGHRHLGWFIQRIDEALDVIPIPVVGAGLAVLFAPGEVFLEDFGHAGADRRDNRFLGFPRPLLRGHFSANKLCQTRFRQIPI